MAARAKIILACAEPSVVYAKPAWQLGVAPITVSNVRKRFAESRLDGLADRPRGGRPKMDLALSDEERELSLRRHYDRADLAQV